MLNVHKEPFSTEKLSELGIIELVMTVKEAKVMKMKPVFKEAATTIIEI